MNGIWVICVYPSSQGPTRFRQFNSTIEPVSQLSVRIVTRNEFPPYWSAFNLLAKQKHLLSIGNEFYGCFLFYDYCKWVLYIGFIIIFNKWSFLRAYECRWTIKWMWCIMQKLITSFLDVVEGQSWKRNLEMFILNALILSPRKRHSWSNDREGKRERIDRETLRTHW